VITLLSRAQDYFGFKQRSYTLTVPREEENEGLLLLGDPGTGKSQIMHQLIDEIASRQQFEAIAIYDPVGEFLEQHYDPETDIILNPLDARCPYWNPAPRSATSSPRVSFRIILTPRPRRSFLTRPHAASSLTCWGSSPLRNGWCKCSPTRI
jgi:hypothetical protein